MKYKFNVNIGDWSGDGHNQVDKFVIESSMPVSDIEKAFKSVATKIGLFFNGKFFPLSDYEERTLSQEQVKALESIGLQLEQYFSIEEFDEEEELSYTINDAESLVRLLMDIAKTELKFEYEILSENIPTFCYGTGFGYGLFY